MSVERRLRTGLSDNAEVVRPDVDRFLGVVQRRARRRVLTHRVTLSLAVAVAVAAVAVAGPRALQAIRAANQPAPPAAQQSTMPVGPAALSGTFSRMVTSANAAVQNSHLSGRWTMRIGGGTIDPIVVPPGFAGLVTPFQYEVHGSVFRTNLFVGDVCLNMPAGTYRWVVSSNELRFVMVSDPCVARAALLTSGLWQKAP